MTRKKPSPTPSTATGKNYPSNGKKLATHQPAVRQQPDSRWQRSKRHAWDSR